MVKRAKWLIRLLWVCFFGYIYIASSCEHPYTTNPNLRLLVGDTIRNSTHNYNPIKSPDCGKVYFLSTPTDNWTGFYDEQTGAIWSVNTDGSEVVEMLHGKYNNLAISQDGKKLAVQSYTGAYYDMTPESLIVVLHMENGNVESLWISSSDRIRKIVWNNDGDYLYYLTSNAIHQICLSDSSDEVVTAVSGITGFDLFDNDSIYLDTTLWHPEIEPVGQQYVIGTRDIFAQRLLMRDVQRDTFFPLHDSCTPYSNPWVGQPYWFPDGNTLVFSAAQYGGGAPGGDAAEIWILENVFEQIDE